MEYSLRSTELNNRKTGEQAIKSRKKTSIGKKKKKDKGRREVINEEATRNMKMRKRKGRKD